MENGNWKWYEDNQTDAHAQQQAYEAGAATIEPGASGESARREHPKRFGWAQLIAAVLIAALLAGAAGAGVMTLVTGMQDRQSLEEANAAGGDQSAGGGVVIDEETISNTNGVQASQGITLGSAWSSEDTVVEMLQRSMSSVVGIDIIGEVASGSYWYGSSGSSKETIGSGSGVILTADGYIATNAHVVSSLSANGAVKVYLQDGTAYDATLVGTDELTDLAVIKIEAQNLPAANVGISSEAVVGDTVYAIGNPLGVLASSVTDGIISGLDRLVTMENGEMTLMQTNAAVNPGNSGGGLFNSKGELIGIVNAKATGANVEGIGFAIPIDTALPIIRDLMDLGYVSGRPYLGITPTDVYMTGSSGAFGMSSYVTRIQAYAVEEGSPAAQGGMKAGDIILTIDDQEVNGSSALAGILYEYAIGDTVRITVLRDRQQMELIVTLGARGE